MGFSGADIPVPAPPSPAAGDLQSKVFFDDKGEKVLFAIGFDKLGAAEPLSAFHSISHHSPTPPL